MKKFIKESLLKILYNLYYFPTKSTQKDIVLQLISSLHPRKTKSGLVRMGPNGDGGYLVPNDLEGIAACFSPGVSLISDFEAECANRGMEVFLADKSVDGPAVSNEKFHFTKKYIGATDNDSFMTLDTWVNTSLKAGDEDLLLQIDIEGFEYETFLNITDKLLRRFRIIVAEFHTVDQLWNRPFFSLASRCFEKILQTHNCVHIHPNNCHPVVSKSGVEIPKLLEITFYRKDRDLMDTFQTEFPSKLDYDNTDKKTIVLPKTWYHN